MRLSINLKIKFADNSDSRTDEPKLPAGRGHDKISREILSRSPGSRAQKGQRVMKPGLL